GNIYVGYAAIGGEGANLRSEIRMATSADCGDTWTVQPISEPDTLNQGANIAIHPLSGDVHVVWRRFDTVESFLGISPTGCPASPASWEVNNDWPVSEITLGGVTYTIAQAQELLGTKHRGDESIKLAYEVIAAKLNLLTGGGDPVDGFNPWLWAQDLNALIADAEAWFAENPVGSNPKQQAKKAGQNIKKNIQEILQGSGSCADGGSGTAAGSTGDTNAIMVVSSDDLGQTFSAPRVIDESTTFDQGSTRFSFRTTAYPTVAADADGRIYVAWAARGFASIRGAASDGDARIVLSTSTNGTVWTNPYAIDEPNREGHQIKPSLLFAGGQLTLVYYDFRQDVSNIFEGFVIDLPDGERLRHTVDVRVATALPDLAPVFTDYSLISGGSEPVNPSSSASRYTFVAYGDASLGETLQVEYMVPNFPMFADGTTPFIGDYVDVAAPNLINDNGTWRFASQPGDVQVWQAVWSDNRDVIPPPDGDWSKYVAPIAVSQPSLFDPTVIIPSCFDVTFPASDYPQGFYYTGTRNQNVYSASISNGLIVAAPGNNRPLDGLDNSGAPLERGFVVYVQNTTGQPRNFRLSLPSIP
ncbi:MAG: sialidase family protein, partial [Woeseia sp.]